MARLRGITLVVFCLAHGAAPADELTIRFVGNEGVSLSDGATTLLVDLPYESGRHGYMRYEPSSLEPAGRTVCVITHGHLDHFDPGLFATRGWEILGPSELIATLDSPTALEMGERIDIGAFHVFPERTPHGGLEHYSYRIEWSGRSLYFVGDTEDPASLLAQAELDVAFVSPWLSCNAEAAKGTIRAKRVILYHQRADGRDRVCAKAEALGQGEEFVLEAAGG